MIQSLSYMLFPLENKLPNYNEKQIIKEKLTVAVTMETNDVAWRNKSGLCLKRIFGLILLLKTFLLV